MCGIAGVFSPDGATGQSAKQALELALARMLRRGPDGWGIHQTRHALIGHRRLAILDPAAGIQPWVDEASGVVLSYNGEIYNFRELQRDLVALGHRFSSQCDTEVLLHCYLQWGRACLHRLTGMFAFALYDPREQAIWLVRDRLGIKPLFYSVHTGGCIFASSLRALMELPGCSRRIDCATLEHYFRSIRTTFGHRTLLHGVHTLLPGTELWWPAACAQPQISRYWSAPALAEQDKDRATLAAAAEDVRACLQQALKGQLISDVPLGGFLSGGLDSTVITALAVAEQGRGFGAYGVGYSEENFNEWPFIECAVRHFGIECEYIRMAHDSFLEDWSFLIAEKGEPLSTPNEVPILHLAAAFRKRFTVALSGEGADEVLGGYAGPTFAAFDYDRSCGLLGGMDSKALMRGYGRTRFTDRAEHFLHVNQWLSAEHTAGLLAPLANAARTEDPVCAHYRELFLPLAACSTLEAYQLMLLQINLEGLLRRLDSSTMAASVEGRVPFTDHRLVELAFRLPDHFKMTLLPGIDPGAQRNLNSFELIAAGKVATKRLLRIAFAQQIPAAILQRPKMSFPVPFASNFQTHWRDEYRHLIRDCPAADWLLQSGKREQLLQSPDIDPMIAWPLMNILKWIEQFGLHP